MEPNNPLAPTVESLNQAIKAFDRLGKSTKFVKDLEIAMTALNVDMGKTVTNLSKTGRGVETLVKQLLSVTDGVKKVKKSLEHTWIDLIDDKVTKKMGDQLRAIKDLAVGTEAFKKKIDNLTRKGSSGFEIMDQNAAKEQFEILEAVESRLKSYKATLTDVGKTKVGLSIGAGSALQDLNKAEERLKAIRLQTLLVAQSMKDGFDFDTSSLADAIKKMNPEFSKTWDSANKAAEEHFKKVQGFQRAMVSDSADLKASGLSNSDVNKRLNTPEVDDKGKVNSIASDTKAALEKLGIDIKYRLVPEGDSKPAEIAEFQMINDICEKQNLSLEEGVTFLERQVAIAKTLPGIDQQVLGIERQTLDVLSRQEAKKGEILKSQIALSRESRAKTAFMGFLDGGFKGGMTAFARSVDTNKQKVISSGIPQDEKAKLLNQLGYKTSTNKDGELQYEAKGLTNIVQKLEQVMNKGLSGLFKHDSGVIAGSAEGAAAGGEAAEAFAGMASAAEIAEVGLTGLGTAFSLVLGPIMLLVGAFKLYAAAVDHNAEIYKEVHSMGGLSAMGAGKTGILDLQKELDDFRKNLINGGGLDAYNLNTVGKRMDILKAGVGSGLNAGALSMDVKSKYFTGPDPEKLSATAKYMQVTAEVSEILGKDMKESAAEVANLHEELSMSFDSVETFFMNITRSATAAGVSNEKFIKLTRSLANEQVNYGTQLKATSNILELLGSTGAYTSETLSKAVSALLPKKDQTIEQRLVSVKGIMNDPKALQSEIADRDRIKRELKDFEAKQAAAAPDSSQYKEASKEITAHRRALINKENIINHWNANDYYGVAGNAASLSTANQMRRTFSSQAYTIGGDKGAGKAMALMEKGSSYKEVAAALANVNTDMKEKLQELFKVDDVNEIPQTLMSMREGGQNKIVDSIFDQEGNKKDVTKEEGAQQVAELKKLGITLDKSTTRSSLLEQFNTKFGDKDTVSRRAIDIADVANTLYKGVDKDTEVANTQASADKGMEESDHILNGIKGAIEDSNSLLGDIVNGLPWFRSAREKRLKEAEDKADQAKVDKARVAKNEVIAKVTHNTITNPEGQFSDKLANEAKDTIKAQIEKREQAKKKKGADTAELDKEIAAYKADLDKLGGEQVAKNSHAEKKDLSEELDPTYTDGPVMREAMIDKYEKKHNIQGLLDTKTAVSMDGGKYTQHSFNDTDNKFTNKTEEDLLSKKSNMTADQKEALINELRALQSTLKENSSSNKTITDTISKLGDTNYVFNGSPSQEKAGGPAARSGTSARPGSRGPH